MTAKRQPTVLVIGGPNGAGKTTLALQQLSNRLQMQEFVNADLIARGLSPLNPASVAYQAGEVMLRRIRSLVDRSEDFAFETTLAGRTYLPLLERIRELGYRLELFFVCLASVELHVERVASRVRAGGHDVPEADVRRRYERSLRNLFDRYIDVFDSWVIYDNSGGRPRRIASGGVARPTEVVDQERYDEIRCTGD